MDNSLLGKIRRLLKRPSGLKGRLPVSDLPAEKEVEEVDAPPSPGLEATAPTVQAGAKLSGSPQTLRLRVRDAPGDISVTLQPGAQIILGRADDFKIPERLMDLSRYDALELGVSRRHAAITLVKGSDRFFTFTVQDLRSSNGTYRNGVRLDPRTARILRQGDKIRLGKLVIKVEWFEPNIVYGPEIHAWRVWHGIILFSDSDSDMTWSDDERNWDAALEVAASYGWQPALGNSQSYQRGIKVTEKDARVLAVGLERALSDVSGHPVEPVIRRHGSGWRELIAFCRLGGFTIGPPGPFSGNPGE